MTVADLIAQLAKLNENAKVVMWNDEWSDWDDEGPSVAADLGDGRVGLK